MFRIISLLLVSMALFATSARASEDCSSHMFDPTGKVTPASVDSAIRQLSADGADPRIRVVTDAELAHYGTLDKYAVDMVKNCPSWQSPGGNIKNNLLVVAIAPNGIVGIFFSKSGPLMALQGNTANVRSEMANALHAGDVATAIKAGADSMHGYLSSRTKTQGVVANGPVIINNEKPTDLSFMWALLGCAVIAAAVWFFVRVKLAKSAREAAQQTAQSKRTACNNLIIGFDDKMLHVKSLLAVTKSTLEAADATKLQNSVDELSSKIESATLQFGNMQSFANDPERSGLSEEQYTAMAVEYSQMFDVLQGVDSRISETERLIRNPKGEPQRYETRKVRAVSVPAEPDKPKPSTSKHHHHSHTTVVVQQSAPSIDPLAAAIVASELSESHHHNHHHSYDSDSGSSSSGGFGSLFGGDSGSSSSSFDIGGDSGSSSSSFDIGGDSGGSFGGDSGGFGGDSGSSF